MSISIRRPLPGPDRRGQRVAPRLAETVQGRPRLSPLRRAACSSASATSSTSTGTRARIGDHVRRAAGGRDGLPRLARPDPRPGAQRAPAQQRGRPPGTPPGTRYTFEGAVATALGPRDEAWLETRHRRPTRRDRDHAVVVRRDRRPLPAESGPRAHVAPGPLAHARRSRARPTCSRTSIDCSRRPIRSSPTSPIPWHAWAELVAFSRHRGRDDPAGQRPLASSNRPSRRSATGATPCRSPTRAGRWRSRASTRNGELDEEWWGGGAGRSITLAAHRHRLDGRPARS